jgi:hypothetical protein
MLHASSTAPASAVARANEPGERPLGESSEDDVR